MQATADAAQARLSLGTGNWADGITVGLSRVANGFTNFTASTSAIMGDFFVNLEDGFANSIGQAVVGAEDLGDALKNVAKQITSQLISALVKMGIQYLANQVISTSAGEAAIATTATTSAAAAAATATAWAPAAALVNAATYGASADVGLVSLEAIYGTAQLMGASALAGFDKGGYTGSQFGTSDVAGVVHGQEFVINADATRRNRSLLEAINSGKRVVMAQPAPTQSAGGINVSVENNGTPQQYTVEQLSPSEVRLIAEDVVARKAPGVIARDLGNPNSSTSKSLRNNTLTPRRRSS
jgi:hypothetical protein